MSRHITPWSTEPCDACGCDHQATRTEARTLKQDEELLCEGCEMYARGVRDERERCARVCEGLSNSAPRATPVRFVPHWATDQCAAAIRGLGDE